MGIASVLTSLGEALAGVFVSVANTLSGIFFTITEAGAVNVTPLGYLALIGLVLGIVYFIFNWVTKLIKGKK